MNLTCKLNLGLGNGREIMRSKEMAAVGANGPPDVIRTYRGVAEGRRVGVSSADGSVAGVVLASVRSNNTRFAAPGPFGRRPEIVEQDEGSKKLKGQIL